jgi:21S rRNA (uridine2791-2'-O)-methyltransferase
MFALYPVRFWKNACQLQVIGQARQASSKRWQARQQKDQFTREAAVQGLKSRAAFKLLQVIEPTVPLYFHCYGFI